ncbi:MAG: cupin domain-containing protein [Gemmatimonadetes bacterium]|nr:cupin domain-containing protein [Gemmatimonadota bacterium]
MPVTRLSETTAEEFPWGTLNWLMGQAIDPDAKQTFGMAVIQPGQQNPPHYHPNCEEILYVVSGTCEHTYGDNSYQLKPGDSIRVSAGVIHHAINNGDEPLRAIISFSSGDRQTVFLE